MFSKSVFVFIGLIVIGNVLAFPNPANSLDDPSLFDVPLDDSSLLDTDEGRTFNRRQAYPSYTYDYFNVPSSYYNSYPAYNYYPSQQPQVIYYTYPLPASPTSQQQPPTSQQQPPKRKKTYRRRNGQRIEATSQKYTVWDLARK